MENHHRAARSEGMSRIPTLMTESIRYAQIRYGDGAEAFAINLPPQTPPAVYEMVIRRLGRGHSQRDAGD